MIYLRVIYNSFLYALTVAILCFKWEWLQMRVNTGLIFFGLWLVLSVLLSVIAVKKNLTFGKKTTLISLAVYVVVGLVFYGFSRLQVVPAALIREGLNMTSIPFRTINIVLLIIMIAGVLAAFVKDKKQIG